MSIGSRHKIANSVSLLQGADLRYLATLRAFPDPDAPAAVAALGDLALLAIALIPGPALLLGVAICLPIRYRKKSSRCRRHLSWSDISAVTCWRKVYSLIRSQGLTVFSCDDRRSGINAPCFVFQDTPPDEEIAATPGRLSRGRIKPILCGGMGGPHTKKMSRALEAAGALVRRGARLEQNA